MGTAVSSPSVEILLNDCGGCGGEEKNRLGEEGQGFEDRLDRAGWRAAFGLQRRRSAWRKARLEETVKYAKPAQGIRQEISEEFFQAIVDMIAGCRLKMSGARACYITQRGEGRACPRTENGRKALPRPSFIFCSAMVMNRVSTRRCKQTGSRVFAGE